MSSVSSRPGGTGGKPLYASAAMRMLQLSELSRARVWEIVRRHDPVHVAALIFLLENVRSERNKIKVHVQDVVFGDDPESPSSSSSLRTRSRARRRNVRLDVNFSRFVYRVGRTEAPSATTATESPDEVDDAEDSRYTVLDVLEFMRDQRTTDATATARDDEEPTTNDLYADALMHNLSTEGYGRFLTSLNFTLFPEHLQRNRDETIGEPSILDRFVRFVRIYLMGESLHDMCEFFYVIVPRPVYSPDKRVARDDLVQPLYQGFCCVLSNDTRSGLKTFNRYGEKIPFLYNLPVPRVDCVLHAIVLPTDSNGRIRSWRYWPYRSGLKAVIVDVFSYDGNNLLAIPFAERVRFLERLADEAPWFVVCPPENTCETIEAEYASRRELHDPICGLIVRRATDLVRDPARYYRFGVLVGYDPRRRELAEIPDPEPTADRRELVPFDGLVSNDCADYMVTCLSYGHDSAWHYVCQFDEYRFHFVHWCRVERTMYEEPRYNNDRIIVLDAESLVRGTVYLRVYYNRFDQVIGVDVKSLTASRFDLPLRLPPLFDTGTDDDEK